MSYLCYIYIIIYRERTKVNREGKSKGTDRQGRKRTRAAPRAVCHPTRLVLFPVSLPLPHVVRVGQSKRASSRRGRGRTKANDAADLFARSSPLLLLRLMSSPSTPSTAAHTIDSRSHLTTSHHHRRDGRPPRPLLGDAIATPRQQPEGQRLDSLPSSPPRPRPRLSSPFPGGKSEGREPARAGDPLPLILPTLSTLPGCAWAYGCLVLPII